VSTAESDSYIIVEYPVHVLVDETSNHTENTAVLFTSSSEKPGLVKAPLHKGIRLETALADSVVSAAPFETALADSFQLHVLFMSAVPLPKRFWLHFHS
jgi:hypothetical protein